MEHLTAKFPPEPDCLMRFAHLCSEASARGWHEANGGNLSYRLDGSEFDLFEAEDAPGNAWHALLQPRPELAGSRFLMSASGAHLRNVAIEAPCSCGIVELDDSGEMWRACWGFDGNARPSSELETHLSAYAAGMSAGDGADRVVYHAHGACSIALSTLLEPSARIWTRMLWRCMTECIIVFPEGVGVVPWMVPGSPELAHETAGLMGAHRACVWSHHGLIVRASGFDEAFGTVETMEKAAGIYLDARAANGGDEPPYLVNDEQLRAICSRYDLHPNERFLI